jgi:uncharacterized protein (DUF302 family)
MLRPSKRNLRDTRKEVDLMSDYTLTTTVQKPYTETVDAARAALSDQGFGVLTEIDLKATLKAKLDIDVEPQVILGACRPQVAHQAIEAEPSIAAVLPCNGVVRAAGETSTVVEAFDPDAMMGLAGDSEILQTVAADAKARLNAALATLNQEG